MLLYVVAFFCLYFARGFLLVVQPVLLGTLSFGFFLEVKSFGIVYSSFLSVLCPVKSIVSDYGEWFAFFLCSVH